MKLSEYVFDIPNCYEFPFEMEEEEVEKYEEAREEILKRFEEIRRKYSDWEIIKEEDVTDNLDYDAGTIVIKKEDEVKTIKYYVSHNGMGDIYKDIWVE